MPPLSRRFGVERRGAPVGGFLRFDEKPVRETHQIYEPDCLVVLDPAIGQSHAVFEGLKDDGIAILNTPRQILERWPDSLKTLGLVDATALALSEMGRAIVNTCMLGVFAKVTGWVALKSVISSLEMHFKGELLKKNAALVTRGYEQVKISFRE